MPLISICLSLLATLAGVPRIAGALPAFEFVKSFALPASGPIVPLVIASDGALYGTTQYGGPKDAGAIFKIDGAGTLTILHAFNVQDGLRPSALVVGSDGALYGTTEQGGGSEGYGTIFKIDVAGIFTSLHTFDNTDGAVPGYSGLVLAGDGALYGTTQFGGTTGNGTVFKIDAAGTFTSLHSFTGTDGANPFLPLVVGSNGALYGTITNGGALFFGTLFRVDLAGNFSTLHAFAGGNSAYPRAPLAVGSDGALYGTTSGAGSTNYGAVFRITNTGTFTSLHAFNRTDGDYPSAALAVGSDGALYGTTAFGGATNQGTAFRITNTGVFSSVHSFVGGDGAYPEQALVPGSGGALYGVTASGGPTGFEGAVFKISSTGTFAPVHAFSTTDGARPYARLALGNDGALYGTTLTGGAANLGTVFKVDDADSFASLHSFSAPDGYRPLTGLVVGNDGALYGTTETGGARGAGTVFKLDGAGAFTSLHSFNGSDGQSPWAALVVGGDGALYGTTHSGGFHSRGTVFRIDGAGNFTSLHSFDGTDGTDPFNPLVLGSDGALYGTTYTGGAFGFGTAFKIDGTGTFSSLHSFTGEEDGANPVSTLVVGSDGLTYGTTERGGGTAGVGAVFAIDAAGALSPVHAFSGSDGAYPIAPLVVGSDGALYGTTNTGGASDAGTIFRIEKVGSTWNHTTLRSFDGIDAASPYTALVVGGDGLLYGATEYGGAENTGAAFKISNTGAFTPLHSFVDAEGRPATALVAGGDGAFYGTAVGGSAYNGAIYRIDAAGTYSGMHTFDLGGADGKYPYYPLVLGSDGALYGTADTEGPLGGGVVYRLAPDADADGIADATDNCPTVANADQADGGIGPLLFEASPDGVGNACDNCVNVGNPRVISTFLTTNPWATLTGGQRDDDHDGFGNKCDGDFTAGGTLTGTADLTQWRSANGKSRTSLTLCGSPAGQRCARYDMDEAGGLIGTPDLTVWRAENGTAAGPKCATCPLACTSGTTVTCATPP